MLGKLRNFSKSKLAIILVAIIIVPFVFWGMGSVFSGGNSNNVAKINNKNISTQDFIEFVNNSRIDPNELKKNINNNVLEEILTQLISLQLIEMEIENIGLILDEENLYDKITKNINFKDENENFSRIKYEKFLLENNISAVEFERKIKESELQKDLFNYVIGGIKSPSFLTKNLILQDTKEIELNYINLEEIYKKEFSNEDISKYINDNQEDLKLDFIDLSYVKLTPEKITNNKEYSSEFFKLLDEIENNIANENTIEKVITKYDLKPTRINNVKNNKNEDAIVNELYNKRNLNNINLIDMDEFYLLYEIKNFRKILPDINNKEFINNVTKKIENLEKFNFNKEILKKIETDNFSNKDFNNISQSSNNIKKITIKSKDDNSFFNIDSLNLLYNLPENDFVLIVDNMNNVYLTKIIKFNYKAFDNNSDELKKYTIKSKLNIKNNISSTYDDLLNQKYKVKVFDNTLDRLKNYFK